LKAQFTVPGKGTVWSLSGSTRLSAVAVGSTSRDITAGGFPDTTSKPKNVRKPE
jgi:general transcription factor 3C polypeptide 2